MASSSVTYTSGTNNFNITFGYLRDTHVIVQVGSTQYDINDNYFTIDTTSTPKVVLNTPVSDGTTVKILRKSLGKNNDQGFLVDFVDGSVLTEKQQDEAYQHNYYINQESKEGNLSVATPILDTDAANKAYVDQAVADGALNNLGGNVTVGGELTIGTDEFKIKGFSATDTELNDAVSAGVSGDSSFGGVITGDPAGHIVVAVNNNDPKDSFSVVTSITVVTTGTSSVSSGAGTITVEAITTALPIGTILYLGSTTLTLTSAASASDTTLTGTFSASIGSGQTLTTYNQNLYENRLKIYPTETVINECSSDHNFRVEGKTNENLLLVDAGNNAVSIANTPATGYELTVDGQVLIGTNTLTGTGATDNSTGGTPFNSTYGPSGTHPAEVIISQGSGSKGTSLLVQSHAANNDSSSIDNATVSIQGNGEPLLQLFDTNGTGNISHIYHSGNSFYIDWSMTNGSTASGDQHNILKAMANGHIALHHEGSEMTTAQPNSSISFYNDGSSFKVRQTDASGNVTTATLGTLS